MELTSTLKWFGAEGRASLGVAWYQRVSHSLDGRAGEPITLTLAVGQGARHCRVVLMNHPSSTLELTQRFLVIISTAFIPKEFNNVTLEK